MEVAPDPDSVTGLAIENLKEFVVTNAELIGSAAQVNANALFSRLEELNLFLARCTRERYPEDSYDFLPRLAKKVRSLVYRAEDVIETHVAMVWKHILINKVVGAFYSVRLLCRDLDALTKEVKTAFNDAVRSRPPLLPVMPLFNTNTIRKKKHLVDDGMVGFKDAMDDVINYLKEGKDDLQTVTIYGMFGLGKTTLARQVLNHPIVENEFSIREFVEVSADFNRKEVLVKLVYAFGNVSVEDMNRMDETELKKAIREYLEQRKYLIILNDVWTREAWDYLKTCLPNNNKRSRVLITTRNLDVGRHAMQEGPKPYKLRFLNPEESRELLWESVFGTKEDQGIKVSQHNPEIVSNILAMCEGIPMAIKVVAAFLMNKRYESYYWEDVSKGGIENMELYYAIHMSFDQLPSRLKPCFLYLGIFPEKFEIIAKTLYQLWVSEGFVPSTGYSNSNETSEEIAESFLELLVDRSLVMVEKRTLNGRIKTIRILNCVHEFCNTKSLKEGFFRKIKYGDEIISMLNHDHDRRLCVNSYVREYITTNKPTGKYVRSFLSFVKEDIAVQLDYNYISEIPKTFKLLRVLDIRSIKLTRIPVELFYAFLLKYFAMFGDLKTIPDNVSNLRYLQTLIFQSTKSSIEIKANISKMKHLRHLQTKNATITSLVKSSDSVPTNSNLQTLTRIAPKCCTLDLFEKTKQLKKLVVCGELSSQLDALFLSLTPLTLLQSLKLINANGSPPLNYLPRKSRFPSKITKLTLQNTMLTWDWMSRLAKLEHLEVLKLKENAFVGTHWVWDCHRENPEGSFLGLKVFYIEKTDLINWEASKDHFPRLEQLYLKHCTKLKSFPSELVNIQTLNLIHIYCCNSEVAKSAIELQNQMESDEKKENTLPTLFVYPHVH